MAKYDENNFENDIYYALLSQEGYEEGSNQGFDYDYGLNPEEFLSYIKDSQKTAWKMYSKMQTSDPERSLVKFLNKEISKKGLVYVLRHGLTDRGVRFNIASFRPETSINAETQARYDKNRLKLIRQFIYSNKNTNTIDLVIQLNGIPIVGIEIKNQFTNQNYEDAINQWKLDRDPNEKVFRFNQRFLVYFALDMNMVYNATKLDGINTYFLPFNQGSNGPGKDGGAGNPSSSTYPTDHLWNIVLAKDNLFDILHRYIHVDGDILVFPRYHQFDVVTKLVESARLQGPRENYLIQHSAGSGKSYSIAWLAYKLSSLHNIKDENVFDSVIIVTDRRVLDEQLQNTIYSLDHTKGLVEKIDEDKSSKDLKAAIESGKKIIITTIQKFPVIYEELEDQSSKNFAIIIDEAHSSQTGSTAKKMRDALGDKEAADEEVDYLTSTVEKDYEDLIVDEILKQGRQGNLSLFAFTATPKAKTLELFGKKVNEDLAADQSSYEAHHIYSMRQAIEEGFILDILENYTTFEMAYKISKNIEDNPELPSAKTTKLINNYQSLHDHTISTKTELMINHFLENTKDKINGKAKAMVVTSSRLHAVRYFHAFKKYILDHNLQDQLGVLVAFSGTVEDGGEEYTEARLNKRKDGKRIKESQVPQAFASDEFKFLIVADKYQTGFDQPLLHTMYVDKALSGVKAVQTLSRLNRTYPGKKDTFVLDFVNTAEEIQEAFNPYYRETSLDKGTDPNILYENWNQILDYGIFNLQDVEDFSRLFYSGKSEEKFQQGRLTSKLQSIIEKYNSQDEDLRYEFRSALFSFTKNYNYITQFFRMNDISLAKAHKFSDFLYRLLPRDGSRIIIDLGGKVSLEFYRLKKTHEGKIDLDGNENLKPISPGPSTRPEDDRDYLDQIIDRINDRYSANFTPGDRVVFRGQSKGIMEDRALEDIAINNDLNIYKDSVFKDKFADLATKNLSEDNSFIKLFEDSEYYNTMLNIVAEATYNYFRNKMV